MSFGDPALLYDAAANALQALWRVDIDGAPLGCTLDAKLRLARRNVTEGLVDIENTEPRTFGAGGFESPSALLQWLEANRPQETPTLTHGDFCLPNIFARGRRLTGFVDCGRMGVSDQWQDIAIALRSLRHNLEGKYNGGNAYARFSEQAFLEKLGVAYDAEKLRYYTLLDELF